MKISKTQGIIALFTATLLWGISLVINKVATSNTDPYLFLMTRYIIGSILMLVLFRKSFYKINRTYLIKGCIIGSLLFFSLLLQILGCHYTTVSKCSFLSAFYVIVVPLLEFILFKTIPSKKNIIAVILCLSGVAMLSLNSTFTIEPGDLISIICGITYGFYFLSVGKLMKKEDPFVMHSIILIVGMILSILAAFLLSEKPWTITTNGFICILYCGIFATTLGFLLQILGQRSVEPTISSIICSFESVIGASLSVLFLHEVLSLKSIIGCILIFAAILLPNLPLKIKSR